MQKVDYCGFRPRRVVGYAINLDTITGRKDHRFLEWRAWPMQQMLERGAKLGRAKGELLAHLDRAGMMIKAG
jgi:hypothetical protein